MKKIKVRLETADDLENLVNSILNENNTIELGIFMSILAYKFIKIHNMTKEQYFESLERSLKHLEEGK